MTCVSRVAHRENSAFPAPLRSNQIHRHLPGRSPPGVVAVSTGADAPNRFGVLPVTKDEHAMAVEKVRHVGDLVACVLLWTKPRRLKRCRCLTSNGKNSNPSLTRKRDWKTSRNRFTGVASITCREPTSRSVFFRNLVTARWWIHRASSTALEHVGRSPRIHRASRCGLHWDPNGRLQLYTPQQVPHYTHQALSTVLEVPMRRSTSSAPL